MLNRLVSDPSNMAAVARRALKLMHYEEPFTPHEIGEADDACVAGCYRCILSYYNQPDHELIDRTYPAVVEYLCALANAEGRETEGRDNNDPWFGALERWGLPQPTPLALTDGTYPLYWPSRDVLAIVGDPGEELRTEAAARGILEIVSLPTQPGDMAPANLLFALGIS